MARHKEFDPDKAIDDALALFRLRGYAATSVDELVQHLGIGRGSLYDTFGSKHALYLAALDRYLEQPEREPMPVVMDANAMIADILFEQVDQAIQAAPLGGCFLVSSAVELAGRDPAVAQRVQANLEAGERLFAQVLGGDATLGLSHEEQQRLARFFVDTVLGLRLMAKIAPDRQRLINHVNTALAVLQ